MDQIFVTCVCGFPNPIDGLDPGLLATLKASSDKYFCSNCGEQLANARAFVGAWKQNPDGSLEVHEK